MSCETKIKLLQDELKNRDEQINRMIREHSEQVRSLQNQVSELEDVVRKLQKETGGAMKKASELPPLSSAEMERFRNSL